MSERDQNQKKDAGKVRLELMDEDANEGLARVLGFGAQKYEANGWRAGMEWTRLVGAAKRHLAAFNRGEDIDPESGLPHIDHLACCVHFLSAYQKQRLGTDDRYRTARPQFPPSYAEHAVRTPPPLVPRPQPVASFDANGSPIDPERTLAEPRPVSFSNMETLIHPCALPEARSTAPQTLCRDPDCQACSGTGISY